MDRFSIARKRITTRAIISLASLGLLCLLSACSKPGAEPSPQAATDESAATDDGASGAVASAPVAPVKPGEWSGAVPDPKATAAAVAADDLFVGWYYEQGGAGRLLACGQAVSLQVADPTMLRGLKAKRGGGPEPVYVRLKVRPVADAKLEVSDVQQFGVDEGPAPNCELVAQRK